MPIQVYIDRINGKVCEKPSGGRAQDTAAKDVSVSDEGGYFTGGNVEGALQEIGAALDGRTSVDVTSVDVSNNVTFQGSSVPAGVEAPSGTYYPVEKTSVTIGSAGITLNFDAFLAYEGAASFSGTWKVFFAGGGAPGADGDTAMPISSPASLAIAPEDNHVYRHTLAASDVITFDTTGLSASAQIAWELHLTQPATAVSFTLPAGILWPDGDVFDAGNTAPDMTTGGRTYVLVFRWDGADILGNLAYIKEVSA